MNRSLKYGAWAASLAAAGLLRGADDPAAPAPAPVDVAALSADNKQLTDELAASWKENADLKASLAAAQAAPAAPAAPASASADAGSPQLADLQDKLATALRSFSLLQEEDAQVKASLDKANSDNLSLTQQLDAAKASIASLQAQAAETAQIAPLQTEVRQAQDEASQLAAENARLRTRLELQAPGPGSSAATVPMRPGQPAAIQAAAPPPPPAPPPPKTYVVADGDTLTRISKKFYGTPGRWEDILNANHGVVKDEKSLVVGSTLTIP